jgi:hypothetical protein
LPQAASCRRAPRTLQHWLAGDRSIPPEAAIVLRLLASGKIRVEDIEAAPMSVTDNRCSS